MPKIQVRRDTSSNWNTANPTLSSGEIGYETDTGKFKIGDGVSSWSALIYFTAGSGSGGGAHTVDSNKNINTVEGGSSVAGIFGVDYASVLGGICHEISGDYSTIGGGRYNRVLNDDSVIAGGQSNTINGPNCVIGGGHNNQLNYGSYSSILGGGNNIVGSENAHVIGSSICTDAANYTYVNNLKIAGFGNAAGVLMFSDGTSMSTAAGGGGGGSGSGPYTTDGNRNIYPTFGSPDVFGASDGVINGGSGGAISGEYASLGGGYENSAIAKYATVAGGAGNYVDGEGGVVAGGYFNQVNAGYSSVLGGSNNNTNYNANAHIIGSQISADQSDTTFVNNLKIVGMYGSGGAIIFPDGTSMSTAAGGGGGSGPLTIDNQSNIYPVNGNAQLQYDAYWGFIGGGQSNGVSGAYAVAAGGYLNRADSAYAAIGGGHSNYIAQFSEYSVIAGGYNNQLNYSSYSSILGGSNNNISGYYNAHIIGSGICADTSNYTYVNNLRVIDGTLRITNIPTSDPGIPGVVWSDSNTLKISP